MQNGQFKLGTLTFGGADDPVFLTLGGWDTGSVDIRAADVENPVGDNVWMGRDRLTPPTWTFTLGVRDGGGRTAEQWLEQLKREWRADTVRNSPGTFSRLTYQRQNRERYVEGRPRRFVIAAEPVAPSPGDALYIVVCDFRLARDVYIDTTTAIEYLTH